MEGLIAAMRGQRRAPTVAEPGAESPLAETKDDDRLAAAAWRAMNLPPRDGSSEEPDHAGGWAYLQRGAVVGRYMVLRELGAGGMGVVYAAYDPELDRKVALKLVLPGKAGGDGPTRLLREAQALAKLSHPNVVGIYDVGTTGVQVWLAMELVRGQTLRAWLREPRAWPDVLRVMRRAGRGLAAAHAAGLLHRDFKPDNVMIGRDGQVRVMDFGLARARPSLTTLAADESTLEAVPVVDTLAMRVTHVGTLLGTPRYMAPEQLADGELTPAADQYALCVTLWEALFGERPFGGETLEALIDNVLAGRVQEPTQRRAVPGWLRRVCERGLSVDPRHRFVSMEALLDALATGRTRARVRRGLVAMGVLALVGAGTEGYRRYASGQRAAACEASGAEVEVAWNPERRQQLYDGLVATNVSYAPTTADKVMPWLERQAQAWREARVEACLDTHVRERWDAETLGRSLWCLDERRMELQSLVDELIMADPQVLQKAVTAASGLASVAPCRDALALRILEPPAPDEREAIRAVRADVTLAGNLARAGRYEKGLAVARDALERAEASAWRPLSAEAHVQLGSLLERTGAYVEAETVLEDAFFAAAEGVAPEVAFDASIHLVAVVGVRLARHADGGRWGRHAEVALASVRDGEHLQRARLLAGLASVRYTAGAYEEAKSSYERALAIYEETLGPEHPRLAMILVNLASVHRAMGAYDEARQLHGRALAIYEEALGLVHPDVAMTLNNLAIVQGDMGAYDEAKRLYERARSIYEQALGPAHPNVAVSLNNLANIHRVTGAYEEAIALHERALAIWEKALGPAHPNVAASLDNLATAHGDIGAHEEAIALNERALAIWEKALGPDHPDVALSLMNLAIARRDGGAYAETIALHERALAIWEKAVGPEHPDVAKSLCNLANVHRDMGAYDRAKALYERAAAIDERALGPEHPDVAHPLVGLAEVALAQQRPAAAATFAQRAVTVREKGGASVEKLAAARFVLARALWEAPADGGRDRERAVRLATQAREVFRAAGRGRAKSLGEVEAWLTDHGEGP